MEDKEKVREAGMEGTRKIFEIGERADHVPERALASSTVRVRDWSWGS